MPRIHLPIAPAMLVLGATSTIDAAAGTPLQFGPYGEGNQPSPAARS